VNKKIGIIGAGHNSLVAACYLAEAGHCITVFEANDVSGGLCINETIFPGIYGPSVASFAGMLRPEIIKHLKLDQLGLKFFIPDEPGLYLFPDGTRLCLNSDFIPSWLSDKDLEALERLDDETQQIVSYLDAQLMRGVMDQKTITNHARSLGLQDWAQHMFTGNWHQFLRGRFENPYLIAALSTNTSLLPDMPGSIFSYLFLCCSHINGQPMNWGRCVGGMGKITQALEQACHDRNVKVELANKVISIKSESKGLKVTTQRSGDYFFDCVVSGASPQATIALSQDEDKMFSNYKANIRALNAGRNSAKIHFKLSEIPLTEAHKAYGMGFRGNTMLVPLSRDIEQLYRIHNQNTYDLPLIYSTAVHSALDPTLTNDHHELFSVDLHYCSLTASDGKPWNEKTQHEIVDRFILEFEKHCPQFSSLINDVSTLTPQTIDTRFHLNGGGCWHVAGVLGQHCEQRPVANMDSYRTPIKGLYLCGAGTFPGGTVTGVPGHNCAQTILLDFSQF